MVSSTCSVARRIASWSMSMAPNTAVSASSEYGGRRSPWRSLSDAIEESTSELDIFPGWSLPSGIAEERGRVIGDDDGNPVVAVDRAAQLADRELRLEQGLRGERTECNDDRGSDDLQLTNQIRTARIHFGGERIAIAGWPMFEHVDDEDLVPAQLNRLQNLRKKLAGLSDERASRFVFARAGRLTDAHQSRCCAAFARDRVLGRAIEIALATRADERSQVVHCVTLRQLAAEELVALGAHDETIGWKRSRRARCARRTQRLRWRAFDGSRGGGLGRCLCARAAERLAPVSGRGRRRRIGSRKTRRANDSHDVVHRQCVEHELDFALIAPLF